MFLLENDEEKRHEQMKYLSDNYVNFISSFENSSIFFSVETVKLIEDFVLNKNLIDDKIYDYLNNDEAIEKKNRNEEERKKYSEMLYNIQLEAEEIIIPRFKRIENLFKEILGSRN